MGVASSAFSLARLALNIPSGVLADRYGRRPLLILGPLLMAVGTLPMPCCRKGLQNFIPGNPAGASRSCAITEAV